METLIIDTAGPDGNAFAIMGYVRKILRTQGLSDEWKETQEKMMSGDYENLKEVAIEATNGAIDFV